MSDDTASSYMAGTAATTITPQRPTWMAGYWSRNGPASGTEQELFAESLLLQDCEGNHLVLVGADIIGFPKEMRRSIAEKCQEKYGIPPESLLLNASHTHCGPEVERCRGEIGNLDGEQIERIVEYADRLEEEVVTVIGDSLDDLAPAELGYAQTRSSLAMNRRGRPWIETEAGFQSHPRTRGPTDHDVPVLAVHSPDGQLRSVVFGYACHNTTLDIDRFCGDWAGYTKQYLREAFEGVVPLYLTGCAGDQNPYPRREISLAKQHGRNLANTVRAALLTELEPIEGALSLAYGEVDVEYRDVPGREGLEEQAKLDTIKGGRAEYLLGVIEEEGSLPSTFSYPVQTARFGDGLAMVALAGEPVAAYSLRLKDDIEKFPVWVSGYSNARPGYVPSPKVLHEGGYEGEIWVKTTDSPGLFAYSTQERITAKVHELLGTGPAQ